MYINDEMIRVYLEEGNVDRFNDCWYFFTSSIAREQEKNIFKRPETDQETINKVHSIHEIIRKTVDNFVPINLEIWNILFADWEKIISNVTIDLIIGFPHPYDAVTEIDSEGHYHIIFDLICWSQYFGTCDLEDVVRNLLTHELCHVLIGNSIVEINKDMESENYSARLDALTFNEAFAHLVSYQSKEIDQVNWHTLELQTIKEKSIKMMKLAIKETDAEKQKYYLEKGTCGKYYDKFICMSGMFYLVSLWEKGGVRKLYQVFLEGYRGFANKIEYT